MIADSAPVIHISMVAAASNDFTITDNGEIEMGYDVPFYQRKTTN